MYTYTAKEKKILDNDLSLTELGSLPSTSSSPQTLSQIGVHLWKNGWETQSESPWRTWEEVKLNFRNKGSGKAGCIPLIYNMVERALL